MSKQDELDKLKKLQEHNDKSREGMLKAYNKRNGEINALEAEIAEEAKPKLRHGDYGMLGAGPRLITCDKTTKESCYHSTDFSYKGPTDSNASKYNILGNIFDDLTALQGDVTEFEVEGQPLANGVSMEKIKVHKGLSHIIIDQNPDRVTILPNKLSAFILGLRQMEATLKRNNK